MSNSINLPTLRGKMGDWLYYVTLISFNELAKRIEMADEIHESREMREWIQRKVLPKRITNIVDYLLNQEQRFFNSIILGIYDGSPQWQELDVENRIGDEKWNEKDIDNFNRTFGILRLSGNEKIFAIDGQHRIKAIKEAIRKDDNLAKEENTVIFVAHKNDIEGKIRTRRLFSTLNRYAKPVSLFEIIALDEEDNCAIITRKLIEEFPLFKKRILLHKNRSINVSNKDSFTTIMTLYDIVKTLLTNKKIAGIQTKGNDSKNFISIRVDNDKIKDNYDACIKVFSRVIESINSLNTFFYNESEVEREKDSTSLLFRPIGQNIFFDVLKVSFVYKKQKEALDYFIKDDFNLKNETWKKIFFDPEFKTLKTNKTNQKYATQLILKHLGIEVKLSKKDKENFENFGIDYKNI